MCSVPVTLGGGMTMQKRLGACARRESSPVLPTARTSAARCRRASRSCPSLAGRPACASAARRPERDTGGSARGRPGGGPASSSTISTTRSCGVCARGHGGGEIDDELRRRGRCATSAQQHRCLFPVGFRRHRLVRHEAAVGEGPQQLIEAPSGQSPLSKQTSTRSLGQEGLLDLLAGELPARTGVAPVQHVEIRALHL